MSGRPIAFATGGRYSRCMTSRGSHVVAFALVLALTAQAVVSTVCELVCLFGSTDKGVVVLDAASTCHGLSGAADVAAIAAESSGCQHAFAIEPAPIERVRSSHEAATVTVNVAAAVHTTATVDTPPPTDRTFTPGSSGRSLPLRL